MMISAVLAVSTALLSIASALPYNIEDLPPTSKVDYFSIGHHHVFRRSADPTTEDARHFSGFMLPVEALNRKFNLVLEPAKKLFHANATCNGKQMDQHGFYQGTLLGQPKSFVHMHIKDNGEVSGTFWETLHETTYHIRPTDEEGGHMIYTEKLESDHTPGTCAVDGPSFPEEPQLTATGKRSRRAVSASPFTDLNKAKVNGRDETICELALFADNNFVNEYGADNVVPIMVERLAVAQAVFDNGVDATNAVDNSGYYDYGAPANQVRVVLTIKWLDYYIGDTSSSDEAKAIHALVKDQTATKEYLEQFSRHDWSEYCLAHAFCYQDFTGTLGLAWTGYPKADNHNGGICQARYNDASKGGMSLNTAWHSSLNFGSKQLETQSALVLAHELGHNFGAQHDAADPSRVNGDYVMNTFAVPGTEPNNKKFSPVSVARIGAVMADRAGCFVNASLPTCGNGIVEEGENCDCGSKDDAECLKRDPCCLPDDCVNLRNAVPDACSPKDGTMGGCCLSTCRLDSSSKACGIETECKKAGVCQLNSTKPCSDGEAKPDNTFCEIGLDLKDTEKASHLCKAGSCTESLCEVIGFSDCTATDNFGEEKGCKIYCKSGTECKPISELTIANPKTAYFKTEAAYVLNAENLATISKPAGASCAHLEGDSSSGVCNKEGECIAADTEEDTLAELKRQYDQFKDTFLSWVKEDAGGAPRYVWLIVGAVLLVGLCCGGCYVANKDEVLEQKHKMSMRKKRNNVVG